MRKILASLIGSVLIVGCAASQNPNDPYENYNREVFAFNMTMDTYVLRPTAVGYTYLPDPLRGAITNFYNNLRDFVSLGNDIFQLDGINTMQTTMRISLNTTFGLLGLVDISTELGLPEYQNSFGNTMKVWGWEDSSYFLVPFLGPGTLRDQLGIVPDVYFNPLFYVISDPYLSWGIFGVDLIDTRTQYLGQDELLEQTLDPYATVRDLYLQKTGSYKYPTKPESVNQTESDSIDDMIDSENGAPQPKVSTSSNDDIDTLIDDENLQQKK